MLILFPWIYRSWRHLFEKEKGAKRNRSVNQEIVRGGIMEKDFIIHTIMMSLVVVSMWFTIDTGPTEEKKEKKVAKQKKNPLRKV